MNWKQEIDEAIQKEPMLDEAFIRNMQQPKRKRRPSPLLPAIVVVLLTISAVLFWHNKPTEQALEQVDLTAEGLLQQYFHAIEQEDYALIERVSATEVTASPKELFHRYKELDVSAYTVLKLTETEEQVVMLLRIPKKASEQSIVRSYVIELANHKVSEQLYEEPIAYKEFQHPESIELTYRAAPVVEPSALPKQPFSEEYVLTNDERIVRYDGEQSASLYVEGAMGTFYVGELQLNDGWSAGMIPHIDEEIMMIVTSEEVMYLYYNEQLQNYQRLFGQRPEQNGVVSYVAEVFDYPIFYVKMDEDIVIGTLQEQQLVVAPISVEAELYQRQLMEVEPVGTALLLKYMEEYAQRSNYYMFEDMHTLVKN